MAKCAKISTAFQAFSAFLWIFVGLLSLFLFNAATNCIYSRALTVGIHTGVFGRG